MSKLILSLALTFILSNSKAQNVGVGTASPNTNAKLDIVDTDKGILIPRMDSLHRIAIPNTQGLLVYDTSTNCFWYNDGTKWLKLIAATSVSSADRISMTHLYLTNGF